MSISHPLSVTVICGSEELFQWLHLTVKLGNLKIKRFSFQASQNFDVELLLNKKLNLLVIDEKSFSLMVKNVKSLAINTLPFPVLVLTDSFKTKRKPAGLKLTFDTLPVPIITINLLEHAITSLLKDYEQTTQLIKLAHFDPLTGAANRLLFDDRLTQSLKRIKRYKEPLSLIYFDLDDFKPVNDRYGHAVGDELLKRFVSIVKSQLRESDTVARMGGDEFALILANADKTVLMNVADKVIHQLSKPQRFNDIDIEIKASLGAVPVAVSYKHTITSSELLKVADKSVYRAKKLKGTSIEYDLSYQTN